ncbi:MAG: DNA-binding protein WhiA [Clostridiales bacterium]|nr:DNA-binding protein WhiA [Clostridiales bacterium]
MSFSSEVKEELSRTIPRARHCQIAEIAAMFRFTATVKTTDTNRKWVSFQTENVVVARKCFTILQKAFNIKACVSVRRHVYLKKNRFYIISVVDSADVQRLLSAIKQDDCIGAIVTKESLVSHQVIMSECCKRAFMRAAFLCSGSITNPEKSYHLEFVCPLEGWAKQIQEILHIFAIDAKITVRKSHFIVYVKESSQISDLLGIMEAYSGMMRLENVRIVKEMRNTVNRKVNCETANIIKTVLASAKQIEDIVYIKENIGFEELSDELKEIALARLSKPEASLKELGASLSPPVGKSGVNHRLRKLKAIADRDREKKGGVL